MARLVEIRGNLRDRIAEAECEGRRGEIEGLQISLAAAEEKIAQIEIVTAEHNRIVNLGIPNFRPATSSVSAATPSRTEQ